ncbi:hypothetical protein, partial [Massilia glaciei]|uniref:hypothetical protein n=1 Tax=Massilia glaciei TaxID=1524097 RepID=UPI001C6334FB
LCVTIWVRPGQLVRKPEKADRHRSTDEVQISSELANLVHMTISSEIALARNSNMSGLDPEIYRFGTDDACAETWSPDAGTRNAQLVEAFESLRTLARVPGSWLRSMWEPSIKRKWQALARPNN